MKEIKLGYVALVKGTTKGIRQLSDKFGKKTYTVTNSKKDLLIFATKEEAEEIAHFYNVRRGKNQYEFEFEEVVVKKEEYMNLIQKETLKGFAAFTEDGKKGLTNYLSDTGVNEQSLTEDISKISIKKDRETIELYCMWFNASHKNQEDFVIKEVEFVITKTLEIKKEE